MIKYFTYYSLLTLIILCLSAFHYLTLDEQAFRAFLSEDGLIEKTSALLFAATSVIMAYNFFMKKTLLRFTGFILFTLAFMREMDWHKKWTTDSILKSRFYSSDSTPLIEKIIGIAVIILLIFCVTILFKHSVLWLKKLWNKDALSWTVFFGLGSIITGKLIDSMARLLPFTDALKKENEIGFLVMEESLELVGAFCFFALSIFIWQKVLTPSPHST